MLINIFINHKMDPSPWIKKPLSLNVQQQFTLLSCSWTTTWNTHTSWDKQLSNCTPHWAPTMRRSAKRCPLVYVSVCLCKRVIICFCANPAPHVGFQITETENMMDRIVSGLSESSIKVRLAAVRYGAKWDSCKDLRRLALNLSLVKLKWTCFGIESFPL